MRISILPNFWWNWVVFLAPKAESQLFFTWCTILVKLTLGGWLVKDLVLTIMSFINKTDYLGLISPIFYARLLPQYFCTKKSQSHITREKHQRSISTTCLHAAFRRVDLENVKMTIQVKSHFTLLWSTHVKAFRKHVGEIDPRGNRKIVKICVIINGQHTHIAKK